MAERVAITKVERGIIETAVRQAVSLAGGLAETINKDTMVLIKPNLFKPVPSGTGLVTDAKVTEAITKVILELRPKSVIIGEGSAAGYDGPAFNTMEAFEVSGTAEAARRLGIECRNLNNDRFEEVNIQEPNVMERVRIAKTALDSDVIISVPVLKTHGGTGITLSLKNMKGVMPGAEKRRSHRLGLDWAIVDLLSVVRPCFAVIDATVGTEGLWQYPLDRREMGLIIAGRNPLAVDIVGASLMGIDSKQVMHLQYLACKESTISDLEQIEVVGEPIEKHRKQFKTGFEAFMERFPGVNIVKGESACTGCTGELMSALFYMKQAGHGDIMEDLNVIIGDPTDPKVTGKVAVLGKCAKDSSHLGPFSAGCPPSEDNMIWALCQVCAIDANQVIAKRNEMRSKIWESSAAILEQ